MKNDEIFMSVIVPVYNTGDKLKDCVNSLINQSITSYEIILVDDGSEEYTRELCDEICNAHKNIIVIHKKNEGPSIARKIGLSNSRGEFISFVDADDYVDYDFLENIQRGIIEHNADIVQAGVYIEYENSLCEDYIVSFPCLTIEDQPHISLFFAEHKYCTDYLCNKVFRRSLFANIIFPDIYRSEDRCILAQLYGRARSVTNIEYVGYHYIQHEKSLSHGGLGNNEYDILKAAEFLEKYYKDKFPFLCLYNHAFYCSQVAQLYFKSKTREEKSDLLAKFKRYDIRKMKFTSKNQKYLLYMFRFSPSIAMKVYKFIVK